MRHANLADNMRDLEQQREEECEAVKSFVEGARSGDSDELFRAISRLDNSSTGWRKAFLKVSRIQSVPASLKTLFLQVFIERGDHMRQEVADDLLYLNGLRSLLPPYDGSPVTLYRGEAMVNRRYRTYGQSWTSSMEVARFHAETSLTRVWLGGNVLLRTEAPPEAIISAPGQIDNRFKEDEFVVDRRLLKEVDVEERFPQLTFDEYSQHSGK